MSVEMGTIVKGKITSITQFGAFIALEGGQTGLVHISEVANTYVADINQFLEVGQEVSVKVISIDPKGKISLSIKKATDDGTGAQGGGGGGGNSGGGRKPYSGGGGGGGRYGKKAPAVPLDPFEEMMKKFKQSSEEKQHELKKKDKRG